MERDFKLRDCRVRPQLCQVEGPDGVKLVEARSMEVLCQLARQAGDVIGRSELIDAVWGDAFVSEETLSHCIWDVRRALGDDARRATFIQTVPRRGYRLIAPISWLEAGPGESERYERIEQLGSGSMGVVWRAEDRLLQRTVALKFLPPEWSRDPEAKKRFLREARLVARLDHPNICPLFELGETDDGRLFLVLPYYSGGTLKSMLADGPVPWRQAVELAIALSSGLEAAHREGIIHRDIKPANLLFPSLDTDGDDRGIKIVDFGIARLSFETQGTFPGSSSAGTPAYKSPEQTRGEKVDHRSDLWALGVILYEMLIGERPFRGEYEQAIVHAILNSEPPSLAKLKPGLPPALVAIVERLLSQDVAERYEDAARLRADLRTLLSSREVRQESDAAESVGSPGVSPSRSWRWGVAAMVVLAVLGMVAWWLPHPEPIRVLVLAPEMNAPALNVLGAGLLVSVLDTLLGFDDIIAIEPSELEGIDRPPPTRAAVRAVGADEALTLRLEKRATQCRVVLTRVDESGQVLWTGDIDTLVDPGPYDALADAVRAELRRAYSGHRWRRGRTEIAVRDEDYHRFLALQRQNLDDAQRTSSSDLRALEQILETSPDFLPAQVALATWAAAELKDTRQLEAFQPYLERIGRAGERFPRDPRPLLGQFELERAAGQLDAAERTLGRLRDLRSGSVQVDELEVRLLRDRGDLRKALDRVQRATKHRTSWRFLYLAGDVAYRLGEVAEARQHLSRLLDLIPDSSVGLAKLAEVELVYGDLEASAELYQQLAERFGRRSYWNNLGTAAYLRGDYLRARGGYQRALAQAPDHPLVLSNLADVEAASGHPQAAMDHCVRVLSLLPANDSLGAVDQMLRARCLARLESLEDAVATALRALQNHPQDAEVRYQAAVVYALADDRTSALVNAREARALGVQPRWFRVPELETLRAFPDFEALF